MQLATTVQPTAYQRSLKGEKMLGLLSAALLTFAGATESEVPGTARFRITGVDLRMPIPDGYCLPTGALADVAQLIAAGDSQNVTHVTLFSCDDVSSEGASDYILIKTPREALGATLSRPIFLQTIGQEFEENEFKAMVASEAFTKKVGDDVRKVLGPKLTLDGVVRPLGKDDSCAYMGGVVKVGADGLRYDQATGGCLSTVGDRVVIVFWYGTDTSDAGVLTLLRKSRHLLDSIAVVPAP